MVGKDILIAGGENKKKSMEFEVSDETSNDSYNATGKGWGNIGSSRPATMILICRLKTYKILWLT